jgi:hypothetical protein
VGIDDLATSEGEAHAVDEHAVAIQRLTGTLRIAGKGGGKKFVFGLSDPRYDRARRSVSYRARRPTGRAGGRLVAAIVVLDLLGAGLLLYALTRPSHHDSTAAAVGVVPTPARTAPQNAPASTTSSTTTGVSTHARRDHPRHLAPATVMTKPSESRAPKVSPKAKAQASNASVSAGAGPGGGALATGARASFAQLRASLSGDARVAVAVQPLGSGRMQVFGGSPAMAAMSTSKVFILALLLDRGGVQNFTAEQKSLAQTAITESDNDSILALFSDLEADKGGLDGASAYPRTSCIKPETRRQRSRHFKDDAISREQVWLDGGSIVAQLTAAQ